MHSSRMRTVRSLPYGGNLPNRDPPGTETPWDRDPLPRTETPPPHPEWTWNLGQGMHTPLLPEGTWGQACTPRPPPSPREQND